MPLLGLVGLTDPCPMVLVLPEMCQPPAAPCQRAFQSRFALREEVLVRSSPLVSPPAVILLVCATGRGTKTNKRSVQNDLLFSWLHAALHSLICDKMLTCGNTSYWQGVEAVSYLLPVGRQIVLSLKCEGALLPLVK